MPYILKKINNRYKVCKEADEDVCFSKKPLSKETAEKQKKAIILNETQGGQSPPQKELYKLYPSNLKNKKWTLYYKQDGDKIKKVSFGHPDYQDYTQHHDKERRKAYLERASNIKGNWKDNPFSSNNLAIHILWGKYTDINKNLNAYLKKIKIKI